MRFSLDLNCLFRSTLPLVCSRMTAGCLRSVLVSCLLLDDCMHDVIKAGWEQLVCGCLVLGDGVNAGNDRDAPTDMHLLVLTAQLCCKIKKGIKKKAVDALCYTHLDCSLPVQVTYSWLQK